MKPAAHGYKDIGDESVAGEPASAEHTDIPDGGSPGWSCAADDPALREAMEEPRRRQRVREYSLNVDVGGGWVADLAYRARPVTSPIILVRFVRNSTREQARLDLDKRMFIDALPNGAAENTSILVASQLETRLR